MNIFLIRFTVYAKGSCFNKIEGNLVIHTNNEYFSYETLKKDVFEYGERTYGKGSNYTMVLIDNVIKLSKEEYEYLYGEKINE